MYRFPSYLTLVSTNHASSNPGPGQFVKKKKPTQIACSASLVLFVVGMTKDTP